MSRLRKGWILAFASCWVAVPLAAEGTKRASSGQDWYRFLGPDLNGKSPEVGIRTDWSDGRLPIVWQRAIGDGYSMPTAIAIALA